MEDNFITQVRMRARYKKKMVVHGNVTYKGCGDASIDWMHLTLLAPFTGHLIELLGTLE